MCCRRSDQLDSISEYLFSKDRAGLLSKCIQSKSLDLGRVHLSVMVDYRVKDTGLVTPVIH